MLLSRQKTGAGLAAAGSHDAGVDGLPEARGSTPAGEGPG